MNLYFITILKHNYQITMDCIIIPTVRDKKQRKRKNDDTMNTDNITPEFAKNDDTMIIDQKSTRKRNKPITFEFEEQPKKRVKYVDPDATINNLFTEINISDNDDKYYNYTHITNYKTDIDLFPYVQVYWDGYKKPTWEPLTSFDDIPKELVIEVSKKAALNRKESCKIINHEITNVGKLIYTCVTTGLPETYAWKVSAFDTYLLEIWNHHEYINTKFPPAINYVYVRVSTRKQSGHNHVSLETQISEINKAIINKGIPTIIIDEIGSAYAPRQKKLTNLIDILRPSDTIYVYSIDRLSRNLLFGVMVINKIYNKNATLEVVNEGISTKTDTQRAHILRGILDAELQSSIMSNKIKDALKLRHPYGYRKINSEFIKHDEEYKILEEILKSNDLVELCKTFNATGVMKRENNWSVGSMRYVINEHHQIITASAVARPGLCPGPI